MNQIDHIKNLIKLHAKDAKSISVERVNSVDLLYAYLLYQKTLMITDQFCNDESFKERFLSMYVMHEIDQENWWFYEIGIPRIILEIMILNPNLFSEEEIKEIFRRIKYFTPNYQWILLRKKYRKKELATGANQMELFYIHLLMDIYQGHLERKKYISALKSLCVYVNDGDGFYLDGSFIQHGHVPYNGSYGIVFLEYFYLIAEILMLNQTYLDIYHFIKDVIERSFLPILYQGYMIDLTSGRSVSRPSYDAYELNKTLMSRITALSKIFDFDIKISTDGMYIYEHMKRYIKKDNYIIGISLAADHIYTHEMMNKENTQGFYQGMGAITYGLDSKYEVYGYHALINPLYIMGVTNSLMDINHLQGQKVSASIAQSTIYNNHMLISYGYCDPLTKTFIAKSYFIYQRQLIVLVSASNQMHTTLYHHFDIDQLKNDGLQFFIRRGQHEIHFKSSHPIKHINSYVSKSFHDINDNASDKLLQARAYYGYMKQVESNQYYQMSFDNPCIDFKVIHQTEDIHHMQIEGLHVISKFTEKTYQYKQTFIKGTGQLLLLDKQWMEYSEIILKKESEKS